MLLMAWSMEGVAASMLMPSASATSVRPSMISLQAWSKASAAVMPLPITSITLPVQGRRRWLTRKVWKYFCSV